MTGFILGFIGALLLGIYANMEMPGQPVLRWARGLFLIIGVCIVAWGIQYG